MARKTAAAPGTSEDVEDILSMFMLAFGQGLAPLHVYLTTMRAIRKKLRPSIVEAVKLPNWQQLWKAEAASVLGFMAAVGCMAAQIAMTAKPRRSIVRPSDFEAAFRAMKTEHEGPPVVAGKWCL